MADEAENKEETTTGSDTAPAGDKTPDTDSAPAASAKPAPKKKAAAKKSAAKKAPARKAAAKTAAKSADKSAPGRGVPLKKLDVKNLADELKSTPSAEPAAKTGGAAPAPVKAVPLKTSSGQKDPKKAAVAENTGPAASAVFMRRVPHGVVTDFLRQLIMLLRAGTPILRSLQTLSKRSSNKAARALISDITQYVEAGNPLWQAFDRHNHYFDRVFVNLIRASEASGTLVTVLGRLVQYRTKKELLRKRVKGALFYPAILILACTLVVLLLSWVVIPQFRDIFEKAGIEMKPLTKVIMDISDWIAVWWWTPYAVVIALFVLYQFVLVKNPLTKRYADVVKIRLPIVGSIMHKHALVQLCRTLALLIRSGVSMMQSLELTRSAVGNARVAECLQDVRDSLERGGGMEGPLRKSAPAIPHVMTDMLVTGEESGRVDEVADQLAEIYEEEVEIQTQTLGEALQPIFTIFVAVGVMVLFAALFLPLITSLDQLASSGV